MGVPWATSQHRAKVAGSFRPRERHPILDVRAIWSLGVAKQPSYYSFEFSWAYTEKYRALAEKAVVEMRVLDRALWQYSSEKQG